MFPISVTPRILLSQNEVWESFLRRQIGSTWMVNMNGSTAQLWKGKFVKYAFISIQPRQL